MQGKVVWYSLLFKNFPHFVVFYIVKSFGIVSKAEVDVFLEHSCFFVDPTDIGNLISGCWHASIAYSLYTAMYNVLQFVDSFTCGWASCCFPSLATKK